MKKFLLIIIILGAGYFIYNKFYNFNPVEIKDNIVVSQVSSYDINSAGVTSPPKFASIEGKIKNTVEKTLTNIIIIYTVGLDTLSAFINFLDAGNTIGFITNNCRIRITSPKYSLDEIKFEEKSE